MLEKREFGFGNRRVDFESEGFRFGNGVCSFYTEVYFKVIKKMAISDDIC